MYRSVKSSYVNSQYSMVHVVRDTAPPFLCLRGAQLTPKLPKPNLLKQPQASAKTDVTVLRGVTVPSLIFKFFQHEFKMKCNQNHEIRSEEYGLSKNQRSMQQLLGFEFCTCATSDFSLLGFCQKYTKTAKKPNCECRVCGFAVSSRKKATHQN